MAAALTDLFRKFKAFGGATTLSAGINNSDTSISVGSFSGYPTDTATDIIIDRVDSSGTSTPNAREVVTGTISSNTMTTDASHRGEDSTSAQSHSSAAVVENNLTANAWNDLIDGILVAHNQDGSQATNSVPTAAIQNAAVDYTKVANGMTLQCVTSQSAAVATGSTTIPNDNTIPQNTEGDQYLTISITPKLSTSLLVIEGVIFISSSAGGQLTVALFQDSAANALATTQMYQATVTAVMSIPFHYSMTSGTTSATTFKIRAGNAAAGTTTFNGQGAAQLYSTSIKSFIKVTEYKA